MGLLGNLVLNLLSGLVGVVVGAFWTSHLQKQEQRARQRGAGRALLLEMQANFRSLDEAARYPKDKFPFTSTVWFGQISQVALLLDWGSFEKVAAAYRYAATAFADGDLRMLLRASLFFCEAAEVLSERVLDSEEFRKSEPERRREWERLQKELSTIDVRR